MQAESYNLSYNGNKAMQWGWAFHVLITGLESAEARLSEETIKRHSHFFKTRPAKIVF